jgi:hypothetical protein
MQLLTLLVEMMRRPGEVRMVLGLRRERNPILGINFIPRKIATSV